MYYFPGFTDFSYSKVASREPVFAPEEREIVIESGRERADSSEAEISKPAQVEVEASGTISTDFSTGAVP